MPSRPLLPSSLFSLLTLTFFSPSLTSHYVWISRSWTSSSAEQRLPWSASTRRLPARTASSSAVQVSSTSTLPSSSSLPPFLELTSPSFSIFSSQYGPPQPQYGGPPPPQQYNQGPGGYGGQLSVPSSSFLESSSLPFPPFCSLRPFFRWLRWTSSRTSSRPVPRRSVLRSSYVLLSFSSPPQHRSFLSRRRIADDGLSPFFPKPCSSRSFSAAVQQLSSTGTRPQPVRTSFRSVGFRERENEGRGDRELQSEG